MHVKLKEIYYCNDVCIIKHQPGGISLISFVLYAKVAGTELLLRREQDILLLYMK